MDCLVTNSLVALAVGCVVAYPTAKIVRFWHNRLDPSIEWASWEGWAATALCPILFAIAGVRYGTLCVLSGLPLALALFGIWVGIVVAVIDWRTRFIPAEMIYGATVVAVGTRTLIDGSLTGTLLGLVAGVVVWGIIYGLAFALYRSSEPFGLGDIVLGSFIGAIIGWPLAIYAFLIGIMSGGVFAGIFVLRGRNTRDYIAYGPFMIFGMVVALLLFARGLLG